MSDRNLPFRFTLALSACALLAATVQAGPGRDGHQRGKRWDADPAEILERLDQNGDGVVTPDDVPEGDRTERMLRRLERLDADGDGEVTLDELEQAKAKALARAERREDGGRKQRGKHRTFESRDADGDGRLSPEEFGGQVARFQRLDSDGDGVVLRDELGDGKHAERKERLFDRLDKDHDGRLTSDEIEASRIERFQRLDADGDGFLTKEELDAKRERRGGGREL